ncbi:MAG: hypothetical protein GWP91_10295 [Rhodobacterales bacterium]|nr:hypothetical protein [Rhodobacterales bacterium]
MNGGFYEQLVVEAGASAGQIRAAYGRAVAKLVKRRRTVAESGGDTTPMDRTREAIDEAWQVLGDSVRRRRYDAMLQFTENADGISDAAFWDEVSPSWVHPAASLAAKLLRVTTTLKEIGPLALAPSSSEADPPTLVPADDDLTSPHPTAHLKAILPSPDRPAHATAPIVMPTPTGHLQSNAALSANVVSLNVPAPATPLKLVDGTSQASSVISLPPEAKRQRSLSDTELNHFVDQHGYTGALLLAVREARGMSVQDVSDTTRISTKYLQAIESDSFDALPSATFVRGYVSEMARVLKLDNDATVAGYMRRFTS